MIKILDRKGNNFILLDSYGNKRTLDATYLKQYMQQGLVVSNAHLSPSGRIMRDKEDRGVNKDIKDYTRTGEIANMTFNQKATYYFQCFLGERTLYDMSVFTIDELDLIYCGSLSLELNDWGATAVDGAMAKDIYYYPTIGAVFKEIISRGYLTEQEIIQYFFGITKSQRNCNVISLADWILMHKKT